MLAHLLIVHHCQVSQLNQQPNLSTKLTHLIELLQTQSYMFHQNLYDNTKQTQNGLTHLEVALKESELLEKLKMEAVQLEVKILK